MVVEKKERPMRPEVKELLSRLPQLFGSLTDISQLRALTDNERALKAIDRLEKVQEILKAYGVSDYISYDLGMLSKYKYYTGIIFKAYTYGTGDYIVTGGRYDKLLVQFGTDRPAVGFAIVIDRLLQALSRQKIQIPVAPVTTAVLYEPASWEKAIRLASHLRANGMGVQVIRKDPEKPLQTYAGSLKEGPVKNLLFLDEAGDTVHYTDIREEISHDIPYSEYVKGE